MSYAYSDDSNPPRISNGMRRARAASFSKNGTTIPIPESAFQRRNIPTSQWSPPLNYTRSTASRAPEIYNTPQPTVYYSRRSSINTPSESFYSSERTTCPPQISPDDKYDANFSRNIKNAFFFGCLLLPLSCWYTLGRKNLTPKQSDGDMIRLTTVGSL
ncbi:hypothetical protein K3495_g10194 [Podosphaera aphanis]|nr:hypothetical protein K3495_g10194 [Podosphaera aphanis]